MIWPRVMQKTLREARRRPLYLATLLGIPMAFMIVFGLALETEPKIPPGADGLADGTDLDSALLGNTLGFGLDQGASPPSAALPDAADSGPTSPATPVRPPPQGPADSPDEPWSWDPWDWTTDPTPAPQPDEPDDCGWFFWACTDGSTSGSDSSGGSGGGWGGGRQNGWSWGDP